MKCNIRVGCDTAYLDQTRLRGLRVRLQAKLYQEFAYTTSNYEKVMYAISV